MVIMKFFNNLKILLYFGSFLFYGYYGNTYTQSILIYYFLNVCDFCNKNKRIILFIDYVKKFSRFYNEFFMFYNKNLHYDYWYDDDELCDIKDSNKEAITEIIVVIPKYEVKYLDSVRRLNKEWTFTEEETAEIINITEELLAVYKKHVQQKKKEAINDVVNEMNQLKLEILENEDTDDIDYCEDEADDDFTTNKRRIDKIATLQIECNKLEKELEFVDVDVDVDVKYEESKKEARQTIINTKLDKIANNYVMETTPSGNVIMIYDKAKASFKYYSDNNIPYRFLEVVSRKYVKMFDCRPLYVDMEEELRLLNERELKESKEREDNEINKIIKIKEELKPIETKNVFAKFKKYNKEAGNKISMAAAPPKNSIPNANLKTQIKTESPEKIILKDTANRYTCEGKFANFSFLKKVEKKVFNKKLGLSFADFKKMKQII
jgi:hypothetical protein